MKYYFIGADGNEISLDLSQNSKYSNGIKGFEVITEDKKKQQLYIRSLAGVSYVSTDMKAWRRLSEINNLKGVVSVGESLKVYRGFKPSGLFSGGAGDLVTDMPGKVVKLLTTEGATVNSGDTLLILEAMKMENEIKAPVQGKVKAVHVSEGQTIDAGTLMIEIEE